MHFCCSLMTLFGLKISKCRLLITFANSLDPDLALQNVQPDLDPICLTLIVFLKEFFEKVDFEKISRQQKRGKKFPRWQRVNFKSY